MIQASYCSICKNSIFDIQQGYICVLTNEKGDFDNECPDFEVDQKRKNEKLKPIVDIIDESIASRTTIWKQITGKRIWYRYLDTDLEYNPQYKNITGPISFSTRKKNKLHYLLFSLPILILFSYSLITEDWTFSPMNIFWLTFILLIGVWGLFHFLIDKKLITINDYGLTLKNNDKIEWANILFAYFEYDSTGKERLEYLTLKLHNLKEKKIDVSELNKDKLGYILLSYLRKCKKN